MLDEKEKRPELAIVDVAWTPPVKPGPPARSSIWVLVAANLVPLAGVWFWDWRVYDALLLYWMENVVIGAFNVARLLRAEDEVDGRAPKVVATQIAASCFFLVHYGGFCLVHGIVLVDFFGPKAAVSGPGGSLTGGLGDALAKALQDPLILVALASFVASHAYSFFVNYIGRREYGNAAGFGLMFAPYKRVVVTHLAILFGAFLVRDFGSPALAMTLFIALKIAFDVASHVREHQRAEYKVW